MKILVISILISISTIAFCDQQVFDLPTLVEIDSKVQSTFQSLTGKADVDEILKEYIANKTLRKSTEVQTLRSNIRDYLRSAYVDRSIFPSDESGLALSPREFRAKINKVGSISKITVQLLLEQLWLSSLTLDQRRPYEFRNLDSATYLRMRLSLIFGDENIGAYGGPGNEWKKFAKETTNAILILSMIVDEDGQNFGIPSFAYEVFSSDSLLFMFVQPYGNANKFLFLTSSIARQGTDANPAFKKSREEWFNFLIENFSN